MKKRFDFDDITLIPEYSYVESRTKNPGEKRPNLHVTGESRNVRQYDGKNYEDVTVRDASPLIWTPAEARE